MNWKKYVALFSLLLITSCAEEERRRGGWTQNWKALYGEKWPLTYSEGIFHCTLSRGKVQSLSFWLEGYDYHIIPLPTYKQDTTYRTIDLIVKPDPKNPGKKMNTDLVLKEGLKWCHQGIKLGGQTLIFPSRA
jgi:hypothetical protein